MSAVIQNEYTGNNSTTTYSFTFPYLKTSDIKASLDGVATTAFTLPNATTLQFNTAPGSGVKIKIFRETSVDDLTATFYAGSAIKSEDLNDNFTQNLYKTQEVGARSLNTLGGTMTGDLTLGTQADIVFEGATADAHETTIKVVDPTADRTITFPNVTGTVVTTGDTGTVATAMIAADAVNGTKIADDSIDSEHYVDGSIDTQHIANAQVTTAKIADDAVTTEKIADNAVRAAQIHNGEVTNLKLANDSVTAAKIANNAVTTDKIADNSINSEHYVDGSIDAEHLASNSVTNAKMADDSVGTAELQDSSVDTARLADNSVTLAKMADSSVGTAELVNDAVTTAKIADDAVTTAKITSGAITESRLGADSVTNAKIANNAVSSNEIANAAVTTAKLADSGVTTAKIANDAVTTVKIVNDAITSAKIADDAVGSTELGDGVIDTVHIGAAQITTAKIADSNITTAKITDANVTTAKIANDAITIGKIGCEQTTISDSDSHIPTSGAVVDYVAAQIAPLGGLEVIATEVAFPNTQPSSGVVISMSDAGGVVVNGSGVSTTGRTVGGSTVTINGFPSSLQSKTMAAGVGLMVSSTGSGQVYNYHKLLAKEADVEQLSNDINDFAARYRVGSSNPTSDLDAGDLFFNTSTSKLLVYNATNSAWEEAQSIGNFFISTFSEAFDGSRTQFTLSNAPANVQQVLLSLNGVVQKPGTAFTLSGSTVTLASAPASGTDYFAVVMGSTVNIGTPSNNTVSTAVLQDDAVTSAKIAASNVTATELAANAVITSKIADDAVTSAKIADGAVLASHVAAAAVNESKLHISNSPVDGYFLSAQSGNAGGLTWAQVSTDLVADTSPQLGGDLASNGNDILMGDNDEIKLGAGGDLKLEHQSSSGHSYITEVGSGNLYIQASNLILRDAGTLEHYVDGTQNGAVNLYYDGTKKFETTANGVEVSAGRLDVGSVTLSGGGLALADNDKVICGSGDDLQIYHDGSHSYLDNVGTGDLQIRSTQTNGDVNIVCSDSNGGFTVKSTTNENIINAVANGSVELYYNHVERITTKDNGAKITGSLEIEGGTVNGNHDATLYVTADNNSDWGLIVDYGTGSSGKSEYGAKVVARTGTDYALGVMQVSGGSHVPAFLVNGDGDITKVGHITPRGSNSFDLGSTSLRWRNIYTNDLHLSNEGHSNEVDGTWGNWTIQEGESDLFLKNNRSGKKYKFNLTEVS